MNTYDEVDAKGQIVSKFNNDIDRSSTYRVSLANDATPLAKKKYVDISADKEYYQARFDYLDKFPDDKSSLDILHEKRMKTAVEKEKKLRQELKNRLRREELEIEERQRGVISAIAIEAVKEGDNKIERSKKKTNKSRVIEFGAFRNEATLKTKRFIKTLKLFIANEELTNETNILNTDSMTTSCSAIESVCTPEIITAAQSSSAADDIGHLELNHSINVPSQVVSRAGRGIRSSYKDTYLCECGCEEMFDKTEIVRCSGGKRNVDNTNCQKLLNKRCCPNWICNDCSNLSNAKKRKDF